MSMMAPLKLCFVSDAPWSRTGRQIVELLPIHKSGQHISMGDALNLLSVDMFDLNIVPVQAESG
jgi:hypothetical protein